MMEGCRVDIAVSGRLKRREWGRLVPPPRRLGSVLAPGSGVALWIDAGAGHGDIEPRVQVRVRSRLALRDGHVQTSQGASATRQQALEPAQGRAEPGHGGSGIS